MNALNINLEFCCTCLKVGSEVEKFLSLGSAPPEDISYKNKLKCCVPEMGLENTEDCYLCKPCSIALETAYTFRCMCLRTETKLEEFRISQRENARATQKNIKLEMLEAISSEEVLIEPEEKFSVGMSTELEELQTNVTEEETYLIDMSVDPVVNEDPLEDVPVSKQATKKRKIDTVKKELGNLLTESSGVFSETNILKSLNAEIDKLNSHRKNPEPLMKDIKKDPLLESKLTQKSDAEIVMIACKTIPELQNCSFESLQCQVSLNKITVTELPVKIADTPEASYKIQTAAPPENSPKKSRFWCHVCKKDVHRRDRYNAHILKHSNIRGYRCKICYQGYFSADALSKHKKICNSNTGNILSPVAISETSTSPEHAPIKVLKQKTAHQTNEVRVKIEKPHRFKVIEPPVVIRKSQRKQTISKRFCNLSDRVFRCELCDYQAYKKQNYQLHILKHTSDKKFACELCDKKYFEQWELKRHIKIKHTSVDKTPSGSGKAITKRKSIEKPLAVNIKIEPDYSEDESLNMASFLEPEITLTTINQEPVVTPVIQSIQSLATTIQEEEVDMLFMCKTCKISFKSRDLLFLHTQTHEWNHKCEVCNLEFSSENEALKHANLHNNIKPKPRKLPYMSVELPPKLPPKKKKRKFFCTVCNLEFACRDHANVHTGAKPYECKHCGKHFAAYSTLRKHRLTHTRDLDEFQSSNKAAKQDANTQQQKYYCEICKREFPKREQIYSHNCQNASGESVYRCQICKNAYIGRTALIEHMGLHVNQN